MLKQLSKFFLIICLISYSISDDFSNFKKNISPVETKVEAIRSKRQDAVKIIWLMDFLIDTLLHQLIRYYISDGLATKKYSTTSIARKVFQKLIQPSNLYKTLTLEVPDDHFILEGFNTREWWNRETILIYNNVEQTVNMMDLFLIHVLPDITKWTCEKKYIQSNLSSIDLSMKGWNFFKTTPFYVILTGKVSDTQGVNELIFGDKWWLKPGVMVTRGTSETWEQI